MIGNRIRILFTSWRFFRKSDFQLSDDANHDFFTCEMSLLASLVGAVNKSRTIFPHYHFKCIKLVKSVMSGPAQGEGLGGGGGIVLPRFKKRKLIKLCNRHFHIKVSLLK